MYEAILNGVLHFFAIFAAQDSRRRREARELVAQYLTFQLGIQKTDDYLGLFDAFMDMYDGGQEESTRRENLRRLGAQLSQTLSRQDHFLLMLRLLELLKVLHGNVPAQERLLDEAAAAFSLEAADWADLHALVAGQASLASLSGQFLAVNADLPTPGQAIGIEKPHFHGAFIVFKPRAVALYILAPLSGHLTVDDKPVTPDSRQLLGAGAVVRDLYGNAIYYSEITTAFPDAGRAAAPLVYEARHVRYHFPGSQQGLQDFSFQETGGRLVGVMGGSGVGKSTLLSLLNGRLAPSAGSLAINGLDLQRDAKKLEGVIGFVPQDDLLFEDLTVFQNLYFNARLCLAHWDDARLRRHVEHLLEQLNQREIAPLRVGSPLDKIISGGQRKRLNIALELMREPAVLLVDEPTSGLSSSDSENVMQLLKEQAARGKLVIVNIHQPSSAIFKMFDTLWILDKGGYPIFMGPPLEAPRYFRTAIHLAGAEEGICPQCGNVNPEQVFAVIESRKLDEDGHFTRERQYPPQFWHEVFQRETPAPAEAPPETAPLPPPPQAVFRPSRLGQLRVFLQRTVLAKLANRQYLAINLLEAPVLGGLTAWLTRTSPGEVYTFGDNPYLMTYYFMSVIIALFMGLSISAEEIVKDRAILQRESFLHLSWLGYGLSKFIYLALLSALQMALCAGIGVWILEIPDMFWKLWGVLFSCEVCACALGLNISASFQAAVTIYILIPLLLIPQMLLSGIVIKFSDLQPRAAPHACVPWAGEVMAARWGVEALAVEQYRANRYQRAFFRVDRELSRCRYLLDDLIPEIRSKADFPFLKTEIPGKAEIEARYLQAAWNGLLELERETHLDCGLEQSALARGAYGRAQQQKIHGFLKAATAAVEQWKEQSLLLKKGIQQALLECHGAEGLTALLKSHQNKSIEQWVRNRQDLETIRLAGAHWVQKSDPVYQFPPSAWGRAPFLAGHKRLGALVLPTYVFNLLVIWLMTGILLLALHQKWLLRLIHAGFIVRKIRKPGLHRSHTNIFKN